MKAEVFPYIKSLTKPSGYPFDVLEKYAREQNVPIMEEEGIAFLKQILRLHRPKKILEIGAAIGYSALQMASVDEQINIVTVERDPIRYEEALRNLEAYDTRNNIQILHGDAFDLIDELNDLGPYDVVFIDAAKGQYQRFFEAFTKNLNDRAVVMTDNVLFKGFVADDTEATKRLSKLSQKINRYNQWLMNLEEFETVIVPIGDGIAISTLKDTFK